MADVTWRVQIDQYGPKIGVEVVSNTTCHWHRRTRFEWRARRLIRAAHRAAERLNHKEEVGRILMERVQPNAAPAKGTDGSGRG